MTAIPANATPPATVPAKTLLSAFQNFAKKLDDRLRFWDLDWWRLSTGPLARLGVRRQNFEAFLWPCILAPALWSGMPTLKSSQLLGVGVSLLCFVALVLLNRRSRTPVQDLIAQVAVLACIGLVVWAAGVDEAGTGHLVYRHLLIPVVGLIGLGLLFSAWSAHWLGKPFRAADCTYPASLPMTELFQVRQTPLVNSSSKSIDLLLALFGILLSPLRVLWAVAIAVLLSGPAYLLWTGLAAFVSMASLMLLAGLDERLESSLHLLMHRLFRGTALVISMLVIGLAAARLLGETYVTTIFDSASGMEIILYLVVPYGLAWWYDYWVDRLLGQQLFYLLTDDHDSGNTSAVYPYVLAPALAVHPPTLVPVDGRTIELHGQGRFLALRDNPIRANRRFQTWSYADLFVQLAAVGSPGGRAQPLPQQIAHVTTAFRTLTGIMTLSLLLAGGLLLRGEWRQEEQMALSNRPAGVSLAQLLDPTVYTAAHPAVLVAASGGGTRAAVFTGATLEGLTELPGTSIAVGSGVSGGAAALAYYAGYRSELKTGDDSAWNLYFDRMTQPFIQDVIERAQEWRMAGHGRLGILLAESFERRWHLPDAADHLNNLRDFGLITNATLAGRFDRCSVPNNATAGLSLAEAAARFQQYTRPDVAGARLVMTNLNLRNAFPHQTPFAAMSCDPPLLPVLVDDGTARPERIAALSANFPPVFSNAAVDVDNQHRYWVTDGGAADNRGLEPILYALREVAANAPASAKLPAVVVVVVEASGIDDHYSQDRGMSGALGAGAHFADQLNTELENNIRALYDGRGQQADVHFVQISMPRMLRTSGSFGTHWMLQGSIHVDASSVPGGGKETFAGQQVVSALRAAYGCRRAADAETAMLAGWIVRSQEFKAWCQLRSNVSSGGSPQPCACGIESGLPDAQSKP